VDGKWSFHVVATSDHMYDAGAIVFLEDDDIRIYAPTTPSQPDEDGGEIEEWQSTDGGVTWANTRHLTTGSKYSHNHVKAVFNSQKGDFRVFWNYGDARNPPETRDVDLYYYGEALPSPQKMALSYDRARPGRLLMASQSEKIDSVIRAKNLSLADVAVDAKVKTGVPQGRHSMICVRVGDGPVLYGAAVSRRRGTVYKNRDGRWSTLARSDARLAAPSAWHDWSLRAFNDRLQFVVDGELLVDTTDPDVGAGSVGIRVRYSSVCLDNVRVRRFSSPEPAAVLPASK